MMDIKWKRGAIEPQTPKERLGVMLLVSLVCHLALFAVVLYLKPFARHWPEVTPTYTVDLVNLPLPGPPNPEAETVPALPLGPSAIKAPKPVPQEQGPAPETKSIKKLAPSAPELPAKSAPKSAVESPRPTLTKPDRPAPQVPLAEAKKTPAVKPTPAPSPPAVQKSEAKKTAPVAQIRPEVKPSHAENQKPTASAKSKSVPVQPPGPSPAAEAVKPKPLSFPEVAKIKSEAPQKTVPDKTVSDTKAKTKSAGPSPSQVRQPSPSAAKPGPEAAGTGNAAKSESRPPAPPSAAAAKTGDKTQGQAEPTAPAQVNRNQSIQEAVQGVEKGLAAKARDQAYRDAVSQVAAKLEAGKVRARWALQGTKPGRGAGSGPTAAGGQAGSTAVAQAYTQRVADLIRSHWQPHSLQRSNLKALKTVIVVRVMANGTVAASWFEQESGDRLYDQSAMTAISRSNPLPALPFGVEQLEIGVTFTPEWKASS
ncbi:MAG: TonB C-terminal domain-containing protein [Deltaproteobacteria bacterium]|nr:TonB C-terminal domain-containing protein [Deltaproteobacteria bacterium]